tara:strand:- start:7486 stop:8853 length:1368 start_codon:yes stop_codon:yes gene_type:complete
MQKLLISSTKKSSGKTVITIGLSGLANKLGYEVQTFKKGPDFIDPSWLKIASKRPCYNLDFNTMSHKEIIKMYKNKSMSTDIGIIEGTKGLYDGVSTDGSDSNAQLAKLLKAEVILVIDCQGITRGISPLLLGYKNFDKFVNMKRVILNNVATSRHESKLLASVSMHTDFKVIGSFPHIKDIVDERHLGLVPSFQEKNKNSIVSKIISTTKKNIDYKNLFTTTKHDKKIKKNGSKVVTKRNKLTIGVAFDTSFGFYYQDDLDMILDCGHRIKKINLIKDNKLPSIDGLIIGGGFPEIQAYELGRNQSMKKSIKAAAENNLPMYAECGGLMYLSNKISFNNKTTKMCNVFDIHIDMNNKPIGRGYTVVEAARNHPWQLKEKNIHAHEFHYSSVKNNKKKYKYAFNVKRGYGINGKKDGLLYKNVLASFTHLRSTECFNWVKYFLGFVERRNGKTNI